MLAYRLTLRRWQLYATATLVAFAVQIALALVWRVPHALELGSSIAVPLVVALVYAFVSADAGESGLSESLVWERFLERAWAVIVLDFLLSYVWGVAIFDSMSSNVLDMLAGLAAFIFSVFFVFADAGAVVDESGRLSRVPCCAVLPPYGTARSSPGLSRSFPWCCWRRWRKSRCKSYCRISTSRNRSSGPGYPSTPSSPFLSQL